MNFGPYPLIYNLIKRISNTEDVTVLSSGWPKYPAHDNVDGISVIRTPMIPSIHSSLKTSFLSMGLFGAPKIYGKNPDIVNCQDIDGSFVLKFLSSKKKHIPKIVSLKGSYDGWMEKLPASTLTYKTKVNLGILKYYEELCVRYSDKIIVPSDFLKNEVIRFYNADEDKIFRIHNGVDTSLFFPQSVDKTRPVLFFTGGDSYRKGADIVIESFVSLKEKYPDLQLIISGCLNIDRFHHIFDQNDIVIGDDILFKGKISYPEMPYYFNLCDIFLMPSYHETFCTSVIEAMACGKPVVVTNGTALPEVVGDCGLLVEPGDVAGFTEAVSKLLDDEALRRKIGKKARKRVEDLFLLERVVENYIQLFKEFD